MKQGHFEEHWTDDQDRPAGGVSSGRGFTISWQNGPLGRHSGDCLLPDPTRKFSPDGVCAVDCTRREPNGAFVEDVIQAVIGRIEFYQASGFACDENAEAVKHLDLAAHALALRTRSRENKGVEGTHEK